MKVHFVVENQCAAHLHHNNYERKPKFRILTTLDDSFDWCEFKMNCISCRKQPVKTERENRKITAKKKWGTRICMRCGKKAKTKPKLNSFQFGKEFEMFESVWVHDRLPFALQQIRRRLSLCLRVFAFVGHISHAGRWSDRKRKRPIHTHKRNECSQFCVSHFHILIFIFWLIIS